MGDNFIFLNKLANILVNLFVYVCIYYMFVYVCIYYIYINYGKYTQEHG